MIFRPIFRTKLFLFFTFLSSLTYSQSFPGVSNLDSDFLESLPIAIQEEFQDQDISEERLETLLRADTSIEKNKFILEELKKKLFELEERLKDDSISSNSSPLVRFGESFFRSIQSTFMPINLPNFNDDYIVDVGDKFNVVLTGKVNKDLDLYVQRDGSIIIPSFGKIFVSKKSLGEIDVMVASYVNSIDLGVKAYVSLSEVRDIQVLIAGGIDSPGIYTLNGGSNILSAINAAGGISANGSFRDIEVKRGGATILNVDLYDIFIFGNNNTNIQLRTGDAIFINPKKKLIPVSGGVNNEAVFELLDNEDLGDLINFAGGFTAENFDNQVVTINRLLNNKFEPLDVSKVNIKGYKIYPRDEVNIPYYQSELRKIKTIEILGMVNLPGTYSFDEGDTISSIIKRAGGYRPNAYVYGGALFREDALNKEQAYLDKIFSDSLSYLITNLNQTTQSSGASAAGVGQTILGLLKEESESKKVLGRVVVDFNLTNISEDVSKDILIEDGDSIFIPPLTNTVFMFGEFRNPINTRYNPNLSIQDYIEISGGLNNFSSEEILIIDPDGRTNIYSKPTLFGSNDIQLYPGSIIYAQRDLGSLSTINLASTVAPILSSLALTIASLNSINN